MPGKDYKLKHYAPGDGAFHLVWVNTRTNQCDGPAVTQADVDRFVAEDPEWRYWADKGYRYALIHQQHRLVAPVRRVDENTLELEGKTYRYEVTPEALAEARREGHLPKDYVKFFFWIVAEGIGRMEYQLRHWSTIDSLRFFLVHENSLAAQPAGV